MNIKSLKTVAKVAAAVAMVGVVSGCVSVPVGTPVKGEALHIVPWEKAHEVKVRNWDMTYTDRVTGGRVPPGTSVVQIQTVDDIFGGGNWNYFLAIVPPGTNPMPKPGDFIEVGAGDEKATPNFFIRILPANCGWRGGIPGIKSQRVGCDSEK